MSLFKIQRPIDRPRGAGRAVTSSGTEQRGAAVNVVSDYRWTLSPKSSRLDTPYIYMIERRLTNNVLLQQLLYNISAGAEVGLDVVNFINNKLTTLDGNEPQFQTSNDEIKRKLGTTDESVESPYRGLYALEDTGWSFVFPYFDNNNHQLNNSWGEVKGSGIIGDTSDAIRSGIGSIAEGANIAASALGSLANQFTQNNNAQARIGTYIESAKQFNYGNSSASYRITFDLLNTHDTDDIIKNWELCFLLIFNNLPNRKTKTVFDPPAVYEIEIPGVRRSPISVIKGLKIDFLGATRIMDLQVANLDRKTRTLVPEVYRVNIDIEDLLPESKNFLQSLIDDDIDIRVTQNSPDQERNANVRISPRDFTSNTDDIDYNGITVIDLNLKNNTRNNIGTKAKQTIAGILPQGANKISSEVGNIINTSV